MKNLKIFEAESIQHQIVIAMHNTIVTRKSHKLRIRNISSYLSDALLIELGLDERNMWNVTSGIKNF